MAGSEDIYDDFDENLFRFVLEQEQKAEDELSKPLKAITKELEDAQGRIKQLETQNTALKKNISCLFKTAQLEVQRKDSLIQSLRETVRELERNASSPGCSKLHSSRTLYCGKENLNLASADRVKPYQYGSDYESASGGIAHPGSAEIEIRKENDILCQSSGTRNGKRAAENSKEHHFLGISANEFEDGAASEERSRKRSLTLQGLEHEYSDNSIAEAPRKHFPTFQDGKQKFKFRMPNEKHFQSEMAILTAQTGFKRASSSNTYNS